MDGYLQPAGGDRKDHPRRLVYTGDIATIDADGY